MSKHVRPMVLKKISVKLEDGTVIKGKINLRSEYIEGGADSYSHDYSADSGIFFTRVSDLFSKGKHSFIVVFDVTAPGCDDGGVLIINKRKILWVSPED